MGCDRDRRGRPRCAAEQVALGGTHSCALSPTGELLCWGDDARGQLGGSSSTHEVDGGVAEEPRFVLQDARAVAAGGAHACAIDAAAAVHCWGDNAQGQVDGEPSQLAAAPAVVGGLHASAVAAGGAHSCALIDTEGVQCWGSARYGQAGREVVDGALAPGLLPGTADAVGIAAGARHSCALLRGGAVLCWGEVPGVGGEPSPQAEPVPVPGLADATAISAGAGFTCALRESGRVVCWGDNASGQLGDAARASSAEPVEVPGLELSLQVAAGGAERDGSLVGHACALTKSFFVYCWGGNRQGQTGQTQARDAQPPLPVLNEVEDEDPYLEGIATIATGGFHSCATEDDGEVLCWGDDAFDQLGARDPVSFGRPVEVRLFRGDFF
jgi:alpha-tubulin suppressor-like RCC1 family protein